MPLAFKKHETNSENKANKSSSCLSNFNQILDQTSSLTSDEVAECQQAFDFFDINNHNTIDFKDLPKSFQSLGFLLDPDEMNTLTCLLNVDGNTTLDFSEFCMVIEFINKEQGKWKKLRDAFRVLDSQSSGSIPASKFVQIMMDFCGEEMSRKELFKMAKSADPNNTGRIKYDCFINFMKENEKLFQLKFSQNCSTKISFKPYDVTKNKISDETILKPNRSKARSNSVHHTEWIDSVEKAVSGPILLNSAIIVHCCTQYNS